MLKDERSYYNRKLMTRTLKSELKNNSKMSAGNFINSFANNGLGDVLGEVMNEYASESSSNSLNEKMSAEDAEKLKRRLEEKYSGKKKKADENQNQISEESAENQVLSKPVEKVQKKEDFSVENMNAEKLRNAVIWSEILGEPACKRRRSRRR